MDKSAEIENIGAWGRTMNIMVPHLWRRGFKFNTQFDMLSQLRDEYDAWVITLIIKIDCYNAP